MACPCSRRSLRSGPSPTFAVVFSVLRPAEEFGRERSRLGCEVVNLPRPLSSPWLPVPVCAPPNSPRESVILDPSLFPQANSGPSPRKSFPAKVSRCSRAGILLPCLIAVCGAISPVEAGSCSEMVEPSIPLTKSWRGGAAGPAVSRCNTAFSVRAVCKDSTPMGHRPTLSTAASFARVTAALPTAAAVTALQYWFPTSAGRSVGVKFSRLLIRMETIWRASLRMAPKTSQTKGWLNHPASRTSRGSS